MKKVKKPMTVGQLIDLLNKQDELTTPGGEILLEGEDELNKGE